MRDKDNKILEEAYSKMVKNPKLIGRFRGEDYGWDYADWVESHVPGIITQRDRTHGELMPWTMNSRLKKLGYLLKYDTDMTKYPINFELWKI